MNIIEKVNYYLKKLIDKIKNSLKNTTDNFSLNKYKIDTISQKNNKANGKSSPANDNKDMPPKP